MQIDPHKNVKPRTRRTDVRGGAYHDGVLASNHVGTHRVSVKGHEHNHFQEQSQIFHLPQAELTARLRDIIADLLESLTKPIHLVRGATREYTTKTLSRISPSQFVSGFGYHSPRPIQANPTEITSINKSPKDQNSDRINNAVKRLSHMPKPRFARQIVTSIDYTARWIFAITLTGIAAQCARIQLTKIVHDYPIIFCAILADCIQNITKHPSRGSKCGSIANFDFDKSCDSTGVARNHMPSVRSLIMGGIYGIIDRVIRLAQLMCRIFGENFLGRLATLRRLSQQKIAPSMIEKNNCDSHIEMNGWQLKNIQNRSHFHHEPNIFSDSRSSLDERCLRSRFMIVQLNSRNIPLQVFRRIILIPRIVQELTPLPVIKMILIAIISTTWAEISFAHSGGLDSSGCHAGSQPYHCHRSESGDLEDVGDAVVVLLVVIVVLLFAIWAELASIS